MTRDGHQGGSRREGREEKSRAHALKRGDLRSPESFASKRGKPGDLPRKGPISTDEKKGHRLGSKERRKTRGKKHHTPFEREGPGRIDFYTNSAFRHRHRGKGVGIEFNESEGKDQMLE